MGANSFYRVLQIVDGTKYYNNNNDDLTMEEEIFVLCRLYWGLVGCSGEW